MNTLNPKPVLKSTPPATPATPHRALGHKRKYTYHEGGLKDEARVKAFLATKGDVMDSEEIEDMTLDIDCYYNGLPLSIKAQHQGLKYGHIYFELTTQHYQRHNWEDNEHNLGYLPLVQAEVSKLGMTLDKGWRPSWFITGKPYYYAILRGGKLCLYLKSDIEAYVKEYGFERVRGLSAKVLAGQNGKNTICGYVPHIAIKPLEVWDISAA